MPGFIMPPLPTSWGTSEGCGPSVSLFTEKNLLSFAKAVRIATLKQAADLCKIQEDWYQEHEGLKYPELKSDVEAGCRSCEQAIINVLEELEGEKNV